MDILITGLGIVYFELKGTLTDFTVLNSTREAGDIHDRPLPSFDH